jgi:hypothetical protein
MLLLHWAIMTAAASRLWQAFELLALGEELLRRRLKRENPQWSEQAVQREVVRWRFQRPGAVHGDAVGRVRPLVRRAGSRSSGR